MCGGRTDDVLCELRVELDVVLVLEDEDHVEAREDGRLKIERGRGR